MADIIYNHFFKKLAKGSMPLEDGTVRVALVGSGYIPNKDHDAWAQVSGNEIAGTNYVANGKLLQNALVEEDDLNNKVVFKGDNVQWMDSSLTARYAVMYFEGTAGGTTNPLIACFDFGAERTSYQGTFSVEWNPDGIFSFQQS